jgi:hypothetical protein
LRWLFWRWWEEPYVVFAQTDLQLRFSQSQPPRITSMSHCTLAEVSILSGSPACRWLSLYLPFCDHVKHTHTPTPTHTHPDGSVLCKTLTDTNDYTNIR